jgi:hypothetical protein
MLDRINSCEKYFESDDMAKRVCYCLTHEEIHHWLDENEDAIACWKFDNIAKKFMEGMI